MRQARVKAGPRHVDEDRGGEPEATMRMHGAGWVAVALALGAGAALADPPSPTPTAPTCEAAQRPEREAANLASLVESLRRLEQSEQPGPEQVVPLDNRGYNYGEALVPFPEIPRHLQR
jgi:hypothetical protein